MPPRQAPDVPEACILAAADRGDAQGACDTLKNNKDADNTHALQVNAAEPRGARPAGLGLTFAKPPRVSPDTHATPAAIDVCGEPFRIFFPLAAVLGAAGVLHWVLYGTGVLTQYLAGFHAVTQMQSFLLAFAAGFLLTAVPKRTRSAPASLLEIGALVALLPAVSFAELFGAPQLAQVLYAAAIVTLVQFAVRRFVAAGGRRPPASFVLVPIGLASGVIGAALRVASARDLVPAWLGSLGRSLALEAVFTCLVLGIGGFFFALALRGEAPPDVDKGPREGRRAVGFALAGLAVIAGLVLQERGFVREGLALRAVVAAAVLVAARGHALPARPGANRRTVWLAAWAVPVGLALAAAFPGDRVAWMHVVYIGGFGLLAFAVAAHVTLGHGGFEAARDGRPWQVLAFGALFAGAMVLRATATRMPEVYFGWLAAAAATWLAGAVVWAVFLVPKMWRPPIAPEHAGA